MKHFLLSLIALAVIFTASARGDIGNIDGTYFLGTMQLDANGNLTPVNSLHNGVTWFRSENFALAFVNIGTTGGASAMNEYVSHGQGNAGGPVTVTGFTLWYASNQADGTLQAGLNYYNGRDLTNTTTPAAASFAINLPTPGGTGGTFLYNATVILPSSLWFSLTDANGDFEYGLRMLAGVGNFGPILQVNIPGQTFYQADSSVNATVGTTYNAFERWNTLTQTSGAHNGGPFWFGATGPWAGAAHRVYLVPEPGTGLALAFIGAMGLVVRRRR